MASLNDVRLALLKDVSRYVQRPMLLPLTNHLKIPASVCSSSKLSQRLTDPSPPLSLPFPLQTRRYPPFSLYAGP